MSLGDTVVVLALARDGGKGGQVTVGDHGAPRIWYPWLGSEEKQHVLQASCGSAVLSHQPSITMSKHIESLIVLAVVACQMVLGLLMALRIPKRPPFDEILK